MKELARQTDSIRGLAIAGIVVSVLFVATFGVWANTMSVASAAVAPGSVTSEGNRKAVQHRDGGPVGSVLVREGERVSRGQPLIELDLIETRAEEAVLSTSKIQLLARLGRLQAEYSQSDRIRVPPELEKLRVNNTKVEAFLEQETAFFQARLAAFRGNINLQQQLIEGSRSQISSYEARLIAVRTQHQLTDDEYQSLAPLAEQGLVTKSRTLALQRSKAGLESDIEALKAGIATENSKIASAELQILQIEKQRQEEVSRDLGDVETRLADIEPRLIAARSKLERGFLVSPEDGFVYGLSVFSKGAAITPGQTVVEIVPANDNLVLSANIDPRDVQRLHPGQEALVRLVGLPTRDRIMLGATLKKVSADRFDDPNTKTSYFKAIVVVKPEELKRYGIDLLPGMPAEVMINTGDRTVMRYLLDPILRVYDFAMREQ